MDNKCPKCGAKATTIVNWSSGSPTFDFACGTEQMPGGLVRGDDCYETELARKDELLRRAGKLAELIKYTTWPVSEGRVIEMVIQADALLTHPEVVKVMEKRP